MTKVCPFCSDHSSRRYCLDSSCPMYYKEKDDCLIAAALKTYIKLNTPILSYKNNDLDAMNFGIFPSNEGDIL